MAELYPDFAKILEYGGNHCFIVSVGGLEVPHEMWTKYPISENDKIVISHDIGAPLIPVFAAIWSFIALHASFFIMMAINAAIFALNYFTRPKPPGYSGGDFTSESPTYSWSGIVDKKEVN